MKNVRKVLIEQNWKMIDELMRVTLELSSRREWSFWGKLWLFSTKFFEAEGERTFVQSGKKFSVFSCRG